MGRQPVRTLVAAALAVALAVSGTATPAHAADGTVPVQKVGTTVIQLLNLFSDGGLSPEEIAQLVTDTILAVDDAESVVLTHMDALAAAPWLGAARAHVVEFNDIEIFEEETLWDWAMAVTHDADVAASVFNAMTDRKSRNDLGYAIHTLYPMALTARVKAGFGTTTLMRHYREALESIVENLKPVCAPPAQGDLDPHPSIYHVVHVCTAPDGRRLEFRDYEYFGDWVEGPYSPESLLEAAGAGTSWAVARAVLQTMDNQGGDR
ncbi:hypothetical protein KBX50_00895 [Micromonospora sp. C51]|uniref:hypothetical protein n=1 Tax=Micromonospora sp. C51 TaxID=2824879 RepID=UPI001B377391|nr:hypothetical protein [Micromonospora sp. C51]MBQ1047037.1 hypothetical protein [Micromonospora sp. C51]